MVREHRLQENDGNQIAWKHNSQDSGAEHDGGDSVLAQLSRHGNQVQERAWSSAGQDWYFGSLASRKEHIRREVEELEAWDSQFDGAIEDRQKGGHD